MHRTERDMELHDKNRDGLFSFREYERPSWAYRFHDSGLTDDQMCWWKEDHFNASDVDTNKDGRFSLREMIDNRYVFYSVILSEEDEDGFRDAFH
ncbi:uncharacterized protein [Elaeis guineensis]|uniref:uncharacterized protein isoform X2 n=1 Tax=Elaeis guineensis var. tenera TaxID=51953 RepID=UPI003C6D6B98